MALRLVRFGLVSQASIPLAAFYERAFGFRPGSAAQLAPTEARRRTGIADHVLSRQLCLGSQTIELLEFECAGRPASPRAASDLTFQHLAIVVADMARAYERLSSVEGWMAISTAGPQRLPPSSGGATAFKFRDPEGHPLELLAFAADRLPSMWSRATDDDLCLGIDHSAISIASTARSADFYTRLGLRQTAQTLNEGPEQSALDGLTRPSAEVTALTASADSPHVELLCYRLAARAWTGRLAANDVAATRIIFGSSGDSNAPGAFVDPDGHHLSVERDEP